MSVGEVAAAVREMLMMTVLLMSPFLFAATATSLIVGVIQAGTRMNDLTLSFVPRFAATMLVVYFTIGWAGAQMVAYIERVAALAGALGR